MPDQINTSARVKGFSLKGSGSTTPSKVEAVKAAQKSASISGGVKNSLAMKNSNRPQKRVIIDSDSETDDDEDQVIAADTSLSVEEFKRLNAENEELAKEIRELKDKLDNSKEEIQIKEFKVQIAEKTLEIKKNDFILVNNDRTLNGQRPLIYAERDLNYAMDDLKTAKKELESAKNPQSFAGSSTPSIFSDIFSDDETDENDTFNSTMSKSEKPNALSQIDDLLQSSTTHYNDIRTKLGNLRTELQSVLPTSLRDYASYAPHSHLYPSAQTPDYPSSMEY